MATDPTPAPSALDALLAHADFYEPHAPFPRLAAIVRVLREAINTAPVPDVTWARDRAIALARAEAIAKGE